MPDQGIFFFPLYNTIEIHPLECTTSKNGTSGSFSSRSQNEHYNVTFQGKHYAGILLEKFEGTSAEFMAQTLLQDEKHVADLRLSGIKIAKEKQMKLKRGLEATAAQDIPAAKRKALTDDIVNTGCDCTDRIKILEEWKSKYILEWQELIHESDQKREGVETSIGALTERVTRKDNELNQLKVQLEQAQSSIAEMKSLLDARTAVAAAPWGEKSSEDRAKEYAEKALKHGCNEWKKACGFLMTEIWDENTLATHCPKGNRDRSAKNQSALPSLGEAECKILRESIHFFCQAQKLQTPQEAQINVKMSSKMQSIRSHRQKLNMSATSTSSNKSD